MAREAVYIVTSGAYSSYEIQAAFSTREKAQAFIDEYEWEGSLHGIYAPGIEEFPLDAWEHIRGKTFWTVLIYDAGPDAGLTRAAQESRLPGAVPVVGVRHERCPSTVIDPNSTRYTIEETRWRVVLDAPDEESAIKRAAEMVAMEKAKVAY